MRSKLSGVVQDAVSKKGIPDVVITMTSRDGGEDMAVSDAKGGFSFSDIQPGTYALRFESGTHKPTTKTIDEAPGKNITATFDLVPEELVAQEVVVTGTHVPRLELARAAPVTVVDRQSIKSSGKASVGDVLQALPEQAGGLNNQVINGGDGSVRVDLRGFGVSRTLVLLNGRRVVPGGTGADSSVDLNTIPTSAIQRIEVLKDGASAIYGSDAISGVVNVITRNDFNGTEINGYAGISQRGDGAVYDLGFTTGQVTDKGNVLFSADIYRQNELWSDAREFSKFDYGVAGYDWPTHRKYTGGSTAPPRGFYALPKEGGNQALADLKAKYPGEEVFTHDPETGELRPFNALGVEEAGGDFYNYQPDQYLIAPMTRLNLFSTGSYYLGASAKAYYEALYTHRESAQKLAPEPLLTALEGLIASSQSIYNPYGVDFDDIRRRMVEFDNRTFTQDLDTFRIVTGVKGDFTDKWHWDVSVNFGRTQGVSTKQGLLQRSKLQGAIGPSFRDADGVPRCGTPDAPIDGCVPLDLFGPPGSITPEMVESITYNGTARGVNQQLIFSGITNAELVTIGTATSPIGLAAGYEHRREFGAFINDPLTAQGDTTGNKGEDTSGSYYTNEAFLELDAPILGRIGDFAGKGNLLELSGAARVVSYSTFGTQPTFKLGARISPIRDVALRGTWSTAFRAPTIADLYSGTLDDFPNAQDPCSDRAQGTAVDAQCDKENVPDDFHDDQSQLRARVGGDPNLQPETAQAFTVGMAIEPRWVDDLSLTLDYYNIDVRNSITQVTTDVILASCYSANPAYCDRIHRDPRSSIILSIDDPISNVGGDRIGGIDMAVDYSPTTPIGRVGLTANVNWLAFYDITLGNQQVVRAAGTYDLSVALPRWRGNFGARWARGPLNAALNVRWLGGFWECENNSCSQPEDLSEAPPRKRAVDAYATADLTVGYQYEWGGSGTSEIAVGVNNLFDAVPAYIVNGFTAASDATAYDYMGRYFYARLSHSF